MNQGRQLRGLSRTVSLALGWSCDRRSAREIGKKGTTVEMRRSARDSRLPGHWRFQVRRDRANVSSATEPTMIVPLTSNW